MRQVSILLCVVGLCYGAPAADADAEPIYGYSAGAGVLDHGVAVSPVATSTQCHTEVDIITSEACNTITEQVCNTFTEQACNTFTEQVCNTVVDTVTDFV